MFSRSFSGYVAVSLFVAHTAVAQPYDFSRVDVVLIPVAVRSVQGAFGTVWSTELWYRNNSIYPVEVYPLASSDNVPSIGRTVRLNVPPHDPARPGQFLFVTKPGSEDVQFDLRLFNRVDHAGWMGTKLPVVREAEFAPLINLINVPAIAEVRSALRIYGFPSNTGAAESVTVRMYSNGDDLLATADLPMQSDPRYSAVLDLGDAFPVVKDFDRVRIEVTSDNGGKIWAFVTVVSNATQEVAIVTP